MRATAIRAIWALAGTLLAAPAAGQEQANIHVPGSVTFQVGNIRQQTLTTTLSLLSFSQAVLIPSHRLRISVQAANLDLAGTGVPVRLTFAGGNAQGGTGFSGQVLTT